MAIRTPPPKKNVDRKHFFQKYYVKHRFFSKKGPFLLILCTSKNRVFRGFLGGFWGFPKESRIEKCQKQGFSPYSEKYPIFQKIPNFLNFLKIGVSKNALYETLHTKPMAMVPESAFLEHPLYERYRSIRLCTFWTRVVFSAWFCQEADGDSHKSYLTCSRFTAQNKCFAGSRPCNERNSRALKTNKNSNHKTRKNHKKKKPKNRREKRHYLKFYLIEDTGLSGCALR